MTSLQTLKAQLAQIEAQIVESKKAEKASVKLQKCKLNQRTAHKYFSLQETYMAAMRG